MTRCRSVLRLFRNADKAYFGWTDFDCALGINRRGVASLAKNIFSNSPVESYKIQ
jgi:hypothetical protein